MSCLQKCLSRSLRQKILCIEVEISLRDLGQNELYANIRSKMLVLETPLVGWYSLNLKHMRIWVGESNLFPSWATHIHSNKHNEEEECVGSCKDNLWNLTGESDTDIYWIKEIKDFRRPFFFFYITSSHYSLLLFSLETGHFCFTKSILENKDHLSVSYQLLAPEPLMHQHSSDPNKKFIWEEKSNCECRYSNKYVPHKCFCILVSSSTHSEKIWGRGGLEILQFCGRCLRLSRN